jgi:hypothetical protein
MNRKKPITFAELKAEIGRFTPEQLALPVMWWGDERGGDIDGVQVLDEDWLGGDGEPPAPRSAFGEDTRLPEELKVVWKKGTPVLSTDDFEDEERAGMSPQSAEPAVAIPEG